MNSLPVYTIAILDFVFDEDKAEPKKYRYDVKLTDIETCKIFYDKLTFIYLEMPKFNKGVDELDTRFDKWLYVLRNLNKLDRVPEQLKEKIFEKLFETAEIARFNSEQLMNYEDSLKYYRDLKNSLDTAYEEGRQEGQEEVREEGIIGLIVQNKLSDKEIAEAFNVDLETVVRIRKKTNEGQHQL